MAKIGRNDPCACGSGKKYKRCCLAAKTPLLGHSAVANTAAPLVEDHVHLCDDCVDDEINRLADRAFELLLAGRDQEAEPLCRQLMRDFPDDVEGIDLLSMVYEARGQPQRALELLREALDIADANPNFYAETRSLMAQRQLKLETASPIS